MSISPSIGHRASGIGHPRVASSSSRARNAGYSAIELLAVIGIIAIILAMMVPALIRGREAARQVACLNDLKQIGLGFSNYFSVYERYPMGYVARKNPDPLRTEPGWGWQAAILPFMEQVTLSKMIDPRESITSPRFGTVWATHLNVFHCPSDREVDPFAIKDIDGKTISIVAGSSFAGNYGSMGDVANDPGGGNGFFVRNKALMMEDISDGLSWTFAVGERTGRVTRTPWIGAIDGGVCTIVPGGPSRSRKLGRGAVQILAHVGEKPLNSPMSDPDDFFGCHPGGGHFLMGDGSARFIRETISPAILRAHASRNGKEIIESEEP